MARIEELIRKVKQQDVSEDVKRAAIAELNRRDAEKALASARDQAGSRKHPVTTVVVAQTNWKAQLLQTEAGKFAVESKARREKAIQNASELKQLAWRTFDTSRRTLRQCQAIAATCDRIVKDDAAYQKGLSLLKFAPTSAFAEFDARKFFIGEVI